MSDKNQQSAVPNKTDTEQTKILSDKKETEKDELPVATDYTNSLHNTAKHENSLNVEKVGDNEDPAE